MHVLVLGLGLVLLATLRDGFRRAQYTAEQLHDSSTGSRRIVTSSRSASGLNTSSFNLDHS